MMMGPFLWLIPTNIGFWYESDELRTTFGDYGEELGEFIYPTDIARDGQGRLWVSEYGGNDRIQVFAHDYTVRGREDHDFRRPQSLCGVQSMT